MRKLGQGPFSRSIRALETRVDALEAGSSPGILTSTTTRGVFRRPLRSASRQSATATATIPRWG